MTAPDVPALAAAIQAGDAQQVREMLASATEKERGALATTLKSVFDRPGPQASEAHWRARRQWSREPAAFVAAGLGLVGGYRSAVNVVDRPMRWEVTAGEYDVLAGVLADRAPAWLGQFIDHLLTRTWDDIIPSWPLARRLVRLGAIERPAADEYAVKMIEGLAATPPPYQHPGPRSPQQLAAAFGTGGSQLATALLGDPGLLQDEVWRLFTSPGVGHEMERSTFYGCLPLGPQWADALTRLSDQGHLDRGRLLDACLDAFLRDFPPNHVAWYALMHDRLQPSVPEKAARTGRYVALLAAPGKPGLTVGQRGCADLLDAGLLDPAAFLAGAPPALMHPQKAVATAQLKMIGKLAGGQPAVRAAALATAAQAFKVTRIADALRYAALDPGVAGSVTRACVDAAAVLLTPPDRPAGLHLLVELAATAGAVSGVPPLPPALAGLASGKDRTKLAEAARRLAALRRP